MLEELAAGAVLHDQVQVVIVFNHLNQAVSFAAKKSIQTYIVELDNVWVSDFLEDRDLTVDSFQVGMVLDLFLLVDLQSYLLVQLLVHSNSDYGIGTLSNLLAHNVIAQTVLV